MMSSEETKQKRKTTARRHLMDTLSMKQVGECPLSRRRPLCYSDNDNGPRLRSSMGTSKDQPYMFHLKDRAEKKTMSNSFKHYGHLGGTLQKSKTDKLCTFPAIINDLNTFIYSGTRHNTGTNSSSSTLSDLELESKDVYKSFLLNKSKLSRQRVKVNLSWTKHRPLTPNLIKMLNKAKLSSKVQTEQWVQQLPVLNTWRYSCKSDKADGTSNECEEQKSPYKYRTWIFDDTRNKKVSGSEFFSFEKS